MAQQLGLTLTDLKAGVSWWLSKDKWPHDFHNTVYYELYDLRRNGLSDDWWGKTVDRLWDWRAIRPYTKAEIKEKGLQFLADLQRIYLDIRAQTGDEPVFLDFKWDQIRGLYKLLANIKAVNTPVFPSKLGHFIFPKLFIVMDHKATGTDDYEVFWQSMHKAWSSFDERKEAKKILSEEIVKHSAKTVHKYYPFEIKIIELNIIGKKLTDHSKRRSTTTADFSEYAVSQRKGVALKRFNESFSCKHCRFSIKKLKQMAERGGNKEMFEAFGRRVSMNIYEINTESGYVVMRRSTQKLTGELSINALVHVHNLVHAGEIDLDPHEIDDLRIDGKRETWRWGNYIAALLRHLECQKIV